jgi:MerR family transcriptional regulator, light-induced transcriptional regulator
MAVPSLTIGAAAHRLGVAAETLRSWERRYGLGPRPAPPPGAHRRYSPADMARLERFCRLVGEGAASAEAAAVVLADEVDGVADAGDSASGERRRGGGGTLPVGREGGDTARGLARCAIRMDAPGVIELLDAVIARDGVAAAWQDTIQPALLAVGRKWSETRGRYVEVEHLLSWCVSVSLHRVRPPDTSALPGSRPAPAPAPEPVRRRVLLACAPDEWHSLPLDVLHAALVERRVPACLLGAAVPADALAVAVRRVDPAHVVVWSQVARTADAAALPRADPSRCRVMAAGPGWAALRGGGLDVLDTLDEALLACQTRRNRGRSG